MKGKYAMLLISMLALLVTGACGQNGAFMQQEESLLSQNWGRSFETQKFNQTLNPEAGKELEPVTGFDGQASDGAVDRYHKSFEEGKAQEVVNVLKLQ
jgi:hypothetical protein